MSVCFLDKYLLPNHHGNHPSLHMVNRGQDVIFVGQVKSRSFFFLLFSPNVVIQMYNGLNDHFGSSRTHSDS